MPDADDYVVSRSLCAISASNHIALRPLLNSLQVGTTELVLQYYIYTRSNYRLIIESPRWLATRGKTLECIRELEKIAKVNGTTVPTDAVMALKAESKNSEEEKLYGMISLFSKPRIAKNTTIISLCW